MTTQDLTTAFGQYLGPIVLLLALFKFTDWPLWLMLLVGIPGGVLIGVVNPLSPPPLRFKGAFKALPPKANS